MEEPIVAFQGEPGAYSEAAIIEFFNGNVSTLPCPTFDCVFSAVTEDQAMHGLIPVENSLAGSIHRNYDLMLRNHLFITGEYHLQICHCLLALQGVNLGEIKTVHSHPQALAQCESNISKYGFQPIVEADTAGSARLLVERGDHNAAALASRRAAEVYGLEILAEHMEDNAINFTRFLLLSKKAFENPSGQSNDFKTSIVFSLHNRPGALFKALSVFALREIDLSKIESRPIPGSFWEYVFYIDFIGHISNETCKRAISHLSEISTFQRVLGSYPRHRLDQLAITSFPEIV
jgi:arogenate/prephenate dehydratase